MNTQKPTLVNVIAWTTLASGILNIFWGLGATGTALVTVVGIFCTPITILPTVLGVFEIIYAAKLFSNPAQPVQPSTTIAICEIVCVLTGNVFSTVVGILSLVFYNDTVVKEYFSRLNGTPVVAAPASMPEPASSPSFEAAPVIQESVEPESESPAAPVEDAPSKPKRAPRKMAGN